MSGRRNLITSFLVITLSTLLCVTSVAQAKGKQTNNTKKNNNQNNKNTQKQPQKQPENKPKSAAEIAAEKEVKACSKQVESDQDALGDITNRLRSSFDASPEMTAANNDLKTALGAYEAERQVVLKTLVSNPDYKKSQADKETAQKKMDDVRKNEGSTPEDISDAASASLVAAKKVTDIENDAMATDSKAASLKADLTAASDRVSAQKARFNDSLPQDNAWATAKSKLTADQTKLETARRKLSH